MTSQKVKSSQKCDLRKQQWQRDFDRLKELSRIIFICFDHEQNYVKIEENLKKKLTKIEKHQRYNNRP